MTTALNAKIPLDYQVERDQLMQKQALANAIMQKAFTPNVGQMVGPHYAGGGAMSAIGAPIVEALMAKHMMNKNTEEARALAQRYSNTAAADEKFGHTPVKMKGENGELVDVLVGDRGTIKRIDGFAPAVKQEATAGGQLYDPYAGKAGTWLGEKFGPNVKVNGEVVQYDQRSGKAHQVANRPANVQVSNLNQAQKAGLSEYFKNAAGQVDAMGKVAESSQGLLASLGTLRELHNAGINSNITSGAATTLANLAQAAGIKVDPAQLANTETYNSLITDLWQRNVAQFGGNRGVTKDEAEEIKKLTPLAATSPRAREQLFAIHEKAAQRNIQRYQEANASFAKAAAADDPRLFQIPMDVQGVYTPPAGKQPNPSVTGGVKPTVSNW